MTKTRLATEIGDVRAAEVHSALALHCLRRFRFIAASGAVSLEVRVAGASPARARQWLVGRDWRVRTQTGSHLGERLGTALLAAADEGAPAMLAVGSDCPALGGPQVRAALAALRDSPVVFGPAVDGGYYLVAMRAEAVRAYGPALFSGRIPWGGPDVLDASIRALRRAGGAVHLLEPLADVDRPEDLALWETTLAERGRIASAPKISAIIPTLNEREHIRSAIERAHLAGIDEVLVVDCGSDDGTQAAAREAGATQIECSPGRALQMNAGAETASGDVLVFLHADTTLPPSAAADIREALADPDTSGGAFRFSAGDPHDATDRLITRVGRWRDATFGLPYGDQAIFVRAEDFRDLGGFPDLPVMEDYEFARRLKRAGTIARTRSSATSSTRAWRDNGLVRATALNMAVIGAYRLGVDPEALTKWRRTLMRPPKTD